MSGGDGE